MRSKPLPTYAAEIGAAIREAREAAEVSQQALARAIGYARETVARWEAGTRTPGLADVLRMAPPLKCTAVGLAERIFEKIQSSD